MPRQAQWSYIAGPALATLYTDETATRLERDGRRSPPGPIPSTRSRPSPRRRLTASASRATVLKAWTSSAAGSACWATISRAMSSACLNRPLYDPGCPGSGGWPVDQVLAFIIRAGNGGRPPSRGPAERWPWSPHRCGPRPGRRTLARARGPLPEREHWRAGPRILRTTRSDSRAVLQSIREAIACGDVLQVNLTRREEAGLRGRRLGPVRRSRVRSSGTLRGLPRRAGLRDRKLLARAIPSTQRRPIEARPIKGTVARGIDDAEDARARQSCSPRASRTAPRT